MKYLILTLIVISSCQSYEKDVIIQKSFLGRDGWGKVQLPECICEYGYIPKGLSNPIFTQDSCNKYNIGDTIK
jgi:hypothetical protein